MTRIVSFTTSTKDGDKISSLKNSVNECVLSFKHFRIKGIRSQSQTTKLYVSLTEQYYSIIRQRRRSWSTGGPVWNYVLPVYYLLYYYRWPCLKGSQVSVISKYTGKYCKDTRIIRIDNFLQFLTIISQDFRPHLMYLFP